MKTLKDEKTDAAAPAESFLSKHPVLIFLVIALTVFAAEALVMLLLHYLPQQSFWAEALLDATLLVVLISPALYFFLFQPMVSHIRERRKIEETLLQNEEEQFKIMIRTALDGFWVNDVQGRFLEVNDAYGHMLGYSRAELLTMDLSGVEASETPQDTARHIGRLIETGSDRFETRQRRKDGRILDVEVNANYSKLHGGRIYCFLRDITERKQVEGQMHHLAHYDALTGLPNRRLFSDRLQQAITTAKRGKAHIALLFLDLDKFKPVNDELGHDVGDLLLKEVAKRLQICVRESDTVARIGGDEFVVLLSAIEAGQDAMLVADKILYTLNLPFELAGHSIGIAASIGVAAYPEHGSDDKMLTKNADLAMYAAKNGGRNCTRLYHPDMLGW